MNTKTNADKNYSSTIIEEVIEGANIDEQLDFIEIVNNIETRLIQEEIKKEVDEKGEAYYAYTGTLGGLGYSVVAFLIAFIPFLLGANMIYDSSSVMPGIFVMILPATLITAPMFIAYYKWISEQNKHYYNVLKLRKKLLEKSLQAEIVSGANELHEEWSEVSTIQGDKAAKYLVRIVKDDDTELEKVNVRKFEN